MASKPQACTSLASLVLIFVLTACAFFTGPTEAELGKRQSQTIAEDVGVLGDSPLQAHVQSLGARIAAQSPRKDVSYTFHVLDIDTSTAIAVPAGFVYVSRGVLGFLGSEDELAAVLAHQVAHIALEQVNNERGWRALLQGIEGQDQGIYTAAQELAADELAQKMMHAAGYDPVGLAQSLRSLDRESFSYKGPALRARFPRIHPIARDRIEAAQRRATQLGRPTPAPDALTQAAFTDLLVGLVIGQDARAGVFDSKKDNIFLHPDLGIRIRFPESWTMVNAPAYVGAFDGAVQFKLELQETETTDPKKASAEYFDREAEKRREAGKADKEVEPELIRTKVGQRKLTGSRTAYAVEGRVDRLAVALYWIPVQGKMFRLSCATVVPLIGQYLDDCRSTAGSLRSIRKAERESVSQTTLELAEVRTGEDLLAFGARVGNAWGPERTAAANALSLPYTITAGQKLRYARMVPYTGASTAPPPTADDAPDDADEKAPSKQLEVETEEN